MSRQTLIFGSSRYWEEMVSMWDMVPVPEDVLGIPKVVQQELVRTVGPLCVMLLARVQVDWLTLRAIATCRCQIRSLT